MSESQDVRRARFEERMETWMSGISTKMDGLHRTMGDQQKTINGHGTDLTVLKRDRFWLFGLTSSAFAAAATTLLSWMKHN